MVNAAKINIDELIKDFHKKANPKNRKKYTSYYDHKNQKYFRELVLRAYVKKYGEIPKLSFDPSHGTRASYFKVSTNTEFYRSLVLAQHAFIKPITALVAARNLKVEFSPPNEIYHLPNTKEDFEDYVKEGFEKEFIQYVINRFNKEAEINHEKYGPPAHPETQKYLREIITRAFFKLHKTYPAGCLQRKYAKPFGYNSMIPLHRSLINLEREELSVKSAVAAAKILGIELEIPEDYRPRLRRKLFVKDLNDDYASTAIEVYHNRAKRYYDRYGRPDDHQIQDRYRELVIKAFLKVNKSLPSQTSPNNAAEIFGYSSSATFYKILVYNERKKIKLETALIAAKILGEKLKISKMHA